MSAFRTKIIALFYLKETATLPFCFDLEKSVERMLLLQKEGADTIHIGAVSSSLGATAVTIEEEKQMLLPLLKAAKKMVRIPISVEVVHREVAQKIAFEGINVLSDLSGFRDPEMRKLAIKSQADIYIRHCEHHFFSTQHGLLYERGVVTESLDWLDKQTRLFLHDGVEPHRLIIDPGIGLGKTCEENCEILQNIQKYRELGFRVSVEIPYKSFILSELCFEEDKALPSAIALTTSLALLHVDAVRVRNVPAHQKAFNLLCAIQLKGLN